MPIERETLSRPVERSAAVHAEHLRNALAIALRRAIRSTALLQQLLRSATVEGLEPKIYGQLKKKVAVVSVRVPQLKQSWHQMFPWETLQDGTPSHTAALISMTLRENIRIAQRAGRLTEASIRASTSANSDA